MLSRLTLSLLLLTAVTAFAPAASADPFGAGDCTKAGLCAGGCVDLRTDCGGDDLACVGVSYQVPQCVESPLQVVDPNLSGTRCMGPVCDAINVACRAAFGFDCVR